MSCLKTDKLRAYFGIDYVLQYINSADQKVQLCDNSIIVYSTSNNKAKTLRQFVSDFLLLKIKKMISPISIQKNLRFTEDLKR